MLPSEGYLVCTNVGCGTKRDLSSQERASSRVTRAARERTEMLVVDAITETLPKTHVDCPGCGHYEAFWVMRQTRAADEPTTRIYRCVKCSHTWREF